MLVGTPSFFMSCCYAGLSLALVSHGSGLGCDGSGVAEVIVVDEVEVVVELEHVRSSCWDVKARDVLVGDALEVLHDAAERVAVSGYDDVVNLLELREDLALPERHDASDAVLKALGLGK